MGMKGILLPFALCALFLNAAVARAQDDTNSDVDASAPSNFASDASSADAMANSFSLPEGSDNPSYIEPLNGNQRDQGPLIKSFYGEGFASDKLLRSYVGELHISMVHCDQSRGSTIDHRVVRVGLGRGNYTWKKIVDGILLRAAEFAWQNCPRTYRPLLHNAVDYYYDVHEVDVYLPDGSLAIRASIGIWPGGDGDLWSNKEYTWSVDDIASRQKQEAERIKQAQAAEAQAVREQASEAQQRESQAREDGVNRRLVSRITWTVIIGGLLLWQRERIAGWYYSLTPHPAGDLIDYAIEAGEPIDTKALVELMTPLPVNRIEKRVRQEQAVKLAARAHKHTQDLLAEAEQLHAQARDEAAFIRAQQELAYATIAHEQAKAQLDALRRRMK